MTINDIKRAALQLMFANYSDDLRGVDIDEIDTEEYKQYLVNMDESINRALSRIESAGVLAPKKIALTNENGDVGKYFTRWNLSALASDFISVTRVSLEILSDYNPSLPYVLEGEDIVLPTLSCGKYILQYAYRVKRIGISDVSSEEIDIPDNIAELIPYYVKADLYEEDEPSLAVQARNIFEANLAQFIRADDNGASGVKNIWKGAV